MRIWVLFVLVSLLLSSAVLVAAAAADDVADATVATSSDGSGDAEGTTASKSDGAPPKKKRVKRPKKMSELDIPEVSITKYEFCRGCQLFVETYHKLMQEEVKLFKRRDRKYRDGDGKIDGNQIARDMCDGPSYAKYSNQMKWACKKLWQDHKLDLIEPFAGQRPMSDLHAYSWVREHKSTVCVKVGACTPDKVHEPEWQRTPCDACKVVVGDVEYLLEREDKPKKKRVAEVLEPLCLDLAMRHERPAYLEEHCDEILDTLELELPAIIALRNRLTMQGLKVATSLADKVCREMMGVCTEDEANAEL